MALRCTRMYTPCHRGTKQFHVSFSTKQLFFQCNDIYYVYYLIILTDLLKKPIVSITVIFYLFYTIILYEITYEFPGTPLSEYE